MAGIASVCVGKRGTGKTTISIALLNKRPKGMPVLIYDVNNEYSEIYPEPLEDFQSFLARVSDPQIENHYILIEEATIFFSTRSRFEEMLNVLVRARHTGNIIQLNFHSFASVPKNIYHLLNYVIVFKTNDSEKDVHDRFDNPKVIQAYLEATQSEDTHFSKVVCLD